MAITNPIIYRVTRQTGPKNHNEGPHKKLRPQRGNHLPYGFTPEEKLAAVTFETETVLAKSIADASNTSARRWPKDRIVAIEECSDFDKQVYSEEVITEIFAVAADRGYNAPTPDEYDDYTFDNKRAIVDIVETAAQTLGDMGIIPGLTTTLEYDEFDNPNWLMLSIRDNFSKKTVYRTRGVPMEQFGCPDIEGWDGVIEIAQEIIELAAPLT